jgi:hypothetical protein
MKPTWTVEYGLGAIVFEGTLEACEDFILSQNGMVVCKVMWYKNVIFLYDN